MFPGQAICYHQPDRSQVYATQPVLFYKRVWEKRGPTSFLTSLRMLPSQASSEAASPPWRAVQCHSELEVMSLNNFGASPPVSHLALFWPQETITKQHLLSPHHQLCHFQRGGQAAHLTSLTGLRVGSRRYCEMLHKVMQTVYPCRMLFTKFTQSTLH